MWWRLSAVCTTIEHMFENGEQAEELSPAARERDAALGRLDSLVEQLADVEQQICALHALQLRLTSDLVTGAREFDYGTPEYWSPGSDGPAILQVAHAKHLSLDAAERFVLDALRLARRLPGVLGVLEAGITTLDSARVVCREAVNVPPERLEEYDALVADDMIEMPIASHVRKAARRRAFEVNPVAAQDAAETARRERFVTVRPAAGVGAAALTAVLPAEQAAFCHAVLDHEAVLLRQAGDPRTLSQIMADTLVERVTGQSTASPVPVSVGLVMSAETLLGLDDAPAELVGHGVLPSPAARLLATTDNAWLRRLLTDPVDATVATADTQRRRFDGALRELCLARDQHCRAPGCTRRVRHLDHDHDFAAGGPTDAANGRGYDVRCHTVKHRPGVRTEVVIRPSALHSAYTRWETWFGPPLASIPPPALGYGSTSPPQNERRRRIQDLVTWPP